MPSDLTITRMLRGFAVVALIWVLFELLTACDVECDFVDGHGVCHMEMDVAAPPQVDIDRVTAEFLGSALPRYPELDGDAQLGTVTVWWSDSMVEAAQPAGKTYGGFYRWPNRSVTLRRAIGTQVVWDFVLPHEYEHHLSRITCGKASCGREAH